MASWSLVSYRQGGGIAVGLLELDGTVRALPRFAGRALTALLDDWDTAATELRHLDPAVLPVVPDAQLTVPIRYPRKIVCAGANYFAHLAEMGIQRPDPVGEPYFFLKPPTTTVVGPGDAIVLPDRAGRRIDWEAELGVVIGRNARNLDIAHVPDHIAGYVVLNDVSARDRLGRADAVAPPFGFDWASAKSEDTFCPMGPGVTPAWFVRDPQDLRIRLSVNGVLKQDSSTADRMNSVSTVVAAASRVMTLEPGDVIGTGSPAGVGAPRGEFLQPGDEVVVEIDGLGSLRNPVVDARDVQSSPRVAALGRIA